MTGLAVPPAFHPRSRRMEVKAMSKVKTPLIPAVGYLRKSTKGQQADGKQRQEKSFAQQRSEIEKLAKGKYSILQWFEDDGVSGWKREASRPDFARMLAGVKALGAQAVLVDNLDRFSRAAVDDVQQDAGTLRKAGVRWIVTCSHGDYDLGARYDIGQILRFVVAVWSACEYSRQLSRRVSLARRNAAMEGRRTGGRSPYGMKDDGEGGLKPGDPKEIKTLRWIFDAFVGEAQSMSWIVGELNRKKVPGPRGGLWYVASLHDILSRRAYRGDFSYGEVPQGQFYKMDERGEVVEAASANGKGKVFVHEGCTSP